jgi:hypothetical protein
VGERALSLLRRFTRDQISSPQLQEGLRDLEVAGIMARHWNTLTRNPQTAPCFHVLQLLNSLDQELDSQLERYGESSLWDDLTELQTAVERVRATPSGKDS